MKKVMRNVSVRINPVRFSLIVIIICFGFVFGTIKYSEYVAHNKVITVIQKSKDRIQSLEIELNKYKKEYNNIVKIRDNYRSSIKEIVELLYNKDSHLSIGNMESNAINSTDEVTLLTIRNTVASMKDDQRLLVEVKNYLEARQEFIESFPFIWPVAVQGALNISSGFGFRNPPMHRDKIEFHEGLDIVGNKGDLIVATADGRVKSAGYGITSGWYVVIEHKNGFETAYAHMDKIIVKSGQEIKRGNLIGYMGETGHATGVHLHYEIRHNGIAIDPMNFLSMNY